MRWHVNALLAGNFAECVFRSLPLTYPHSSGGFLPRFYGLRSEPETEAYQLPVGGRHAIAVLAHGKTEQPSRFLAAVSS